MIPTNHAILGSLVMDEQPSKQHRMTSGRVLGCCDNLEAVKQAIFKILSTERYEYVIYSWDYGVELSDLYGKNPDYCCAELERRITEALLQDDRITAVDGFTFEKQKNGVIFLSFTVRTVFGEMDFSKEVRV